MNNDIEFNELLEKMRLELRRGVIVLAVMAQLRDEHYGYSLRKDLEEKGLPMDEGTLYPLVRRLEKQGLLSSEWRVEANRKKRFYKLNDLGNRILDSLTQEWQSMNDTIHRILN